MLKDTNSPLGGVEDTRAAVIRRLVMNLELGHDIDLVAGRGLGLSTALRSLSAELENREWNVVHVRGVPSLKPHSLAALHAAEIGVGRDGRPGGIVTAVQTLKALAATGPLALLVDDWHDLDEVSWGVIETAQSRVDMSVVVGRRPTRRKKRTPSGLGGSSGRGSFVIELQPLTFSEMLLAIEKKLQGAVDHSSVSSLFVYSGGVPSLVFGVLEVLILTDRIIKIDGVWHLAEPFWNPALDGVVDGVIAALDGDERDALEQLSAEERWELPAAEELVGRDALHRLIEAGSVARYFLAGAESVSVSPPILIDSFSARRSALDGVSAQLWQPFQLREEPAPGDRGRRESRAGDLAQEPDATFVRVLSEHVHRQVSQRSALWQADPSPENAVLLLKALVKLPGNEIALARLLEGPVSGDPQNFFAAVLAYARIRMRQLRGEPLAEVTAEETSEARGLSGPGTQFVRLITALECGGAITEADLHTETSEFAPLAQTKALLNKRFLTEVWFGHIRHARVLGEKVARVTTSESGEQLVTEALLLCFEGELRAAELRARQTIELARNGLNLDALHNAYFVLILVLTMRGRYRELPELLDSISVFGGLRTYHAQAHADLLNLIALALVRMGRVVQGESVAARALRVSYLARERVGFSRALLDAQLRAAHGEALSGTGLWASAEQCWGQGLRLSAAMQGLAAIEVEPRDAWFRQIAIWLEDVDSPLLRLQLSLACALRDDDRHELAMIGELMLRRGEDGNGRRAIRRAFELALEAADGELAAKLRVHLDSWQNGTDEFVDERRFSQKYLELTPREVQIVGKIVRGHSNPEIALKLGLSVRTVESHLNRILRKAGVEHRDELRGLVPVLLDKRGANPGGDPGPSSAQEHRSEESAPPA